MGNCYVPNTRKRLNVVSWQRAKCHTRQCYMVAIIEGVGNGVRPQGIMGNGMQPLCMLIERVESTSSIN